MRVKINPYFYSPSSLYLLTAGIRYKAVYDVMMMCSVVLFLPLLSHSHWFSRGAAYVRTDTDVITKPKISRIDGLLYFLSHGGGARSSTMI